MSSEAIPMCEMFAKVCDLATALGVSQINKLPGAWVQTIDEHWIVALNGHNEDLEVTPAGTMGVSELPFGHMAVWFNGWLAGLFTINGGEFAAGSAANEDTFIAALEAAILRAAREVNHE